MTTFSKAPNAPIPAPTGGYATTNPYIVPPEPSYTPAGAGAPATAVSLVNAPIAPVLASMGGLATTNPYPTWICIRARWKAQSRSFSWDPGNWCMLRQRPVLVWQPSRRSTGVYLPSPNAPTFLHPCRRLYPHIRERHAPASAAFHKCGPTSTRSSNPTCPHFAYPCYSPFRTAFGTSSSALSYPELVFLTYPRSCSHTSTSFHNHAAETLDNPAGTTVSSSIYTASTTA